MKQAAPIEESKATADFFPKTELIYERAEVVSEEHSKESLPKTKKTQYKVSNRLMDVGVDDEAIR